MCENSEAVDQWCERVKQAYLANDQVLTDALLEQAIKETNSAPRLVEIGGQIAYVRGDIDKAIRLIGTAMTEISLSVSAQLTLANAWLQKGNKEAAETTLVFLVEIIDRVPCSMLPDLTQALAKLEKYEHAISVCRVAFDRHPDDDNAVFGAAFYMFRAGYPLPLVRSTIAKAIELDPSSEVYRLNMANVCCSMQLWNEAYSNACKLSAKSLSTIPNNCIRAQLAELFQRFEDEDRLEQMNLTKELNKERKNHE